jgi:hypothetical protein
MIERTIEWGRLAPFPHSMRNFHIVTEGSMFTRSFRASFEAEPDIIESWIAESPGLKESTPDTSQTGFRKYKIKPGAGAQGAEVSINDRKQQVQIYVYWS